MKVLIVDCEANDLDFAMRCQDAGHDVRFWNEPGCTAGEGIVPKVKTWQPSMDWADLICVTANNVLEKELKPFCPSNFPIVGANAAGAKLELDRECGQSILEQDGIEVIPFEVFDDYDKAVKYVESTMKAYACKPGGGTGQQALSFGSRRTEDMIFKLELWKEEGLKGKFMLQETVEGVEIGVSGWFGPGGWCSWIEEDFEEKRFMAEGLGPNTGEQGTIIRFVHRSLLFDKMLEPLTDYLHSIKYVGNINVNCKVDKEGNVKPFEFTCRWGWPSFAIFQAVNQTDPAERLLDLVNGQDTMLVSQQVVIGVVLTHGDYPNSKLTGRDWSGYPIRGITEHNMDSLHFVDVKFGKTPVRSGGRVKDQATYVTSHDCILVVTGVWTTVREAQAAAYQTAWQIDLPGDVMFRTDIGDRLAEDLPALQQHGFASGMMYG